MHERKMDEAGGGESRVIEEMKRRDGGRERKEE